MNYALAKPLQYYFYTEGVLLSERVQLKLNIETSVRESTDLRRLVYLCG